MLSRVADAIYWMSRYVERAENVARFLDVSLQVTLDLAHPQSDPWAGIVTATGDQRLYTERYGEATRDGVVRFLTFDAGSQNSILSCLAQARENARSVRDAISSDMWEGINTYYLFVLDASRNSSIFSDPHDFLDDVKRSAHLFVGTTDLTMTHGEGWHFGQLGRLLERADQTSRIVDAKLVLQQARGTDRGKQFDESTLVALLRSVSALEMYRKRYGQISYGSVMGFLLLERMFPRSVRYCLNQAERSLHEINGAPPDASPTPAERLLGRLASEYEFAVIEELIAAGLQPHLDRVQSGLNAVGRSIYEAFFAVDANATNGEPDRRAIAAASNHQSMGSTVTSTASLSLPPPT
ncbi:MAG: alpha-E domain-containing protein [Polyangiaceae bacterium]|jgi:uncharacterized alpha-E superfamily protein